MIPPLPTWREPSEEGQPSGGGARPPQAERLTPNSVPGHLMARSELVSADGSPLEKPGVPTPPEETGILRTDGPLVPDFLGVLLALAGGTIQTAQGETVGRIAGDTSVPAAWAGRFGEIPSDQPERPTSPPADIPPAVSGMPLSLPPDSRPAGPPREPSEAGGIRETAGTPRERGDATGSVGSPAPGRSFAGPLPGASDLPDGGRGITESPVPAAAPEAWPGLPSRRPDQGQAPAEGSATVSKSPPGNPTGNAGEVPTAPPLAREFPPDSGPLRAWQPQALDRGASGDAQWDLAVASSPHPASAGTGLDSRGGELRQSSVGILPGERTADEESVLPMPAAPSPTPLPEVGPARMSALRGPTPMGFDLGAHDGPPPRDAHLSVEGGDSRREKKAPPPMRGPGPEFRQEDGAAAGGTARGSLPEPSEAPRAALSAASIQRVVSAVRMSASRGGVEVRLLLHPESLGDVQVQVRWERGVLTARLEAATPAARDVLAGGLETLRTALQDQRVPVDRLQVAVRLDLGAWSHGQELARQQRDAPGPPLALAWATPAGPEPAPSAAGRLDIRI